MTFSHNIEDYPEGIVLPIDKPYRWTSADVIRKIKFAAIRHFRKRNLKVGHAGTLDPLATGLLLVCIGPATKRAEELQRSDKQYLAGISFGATTASYDREKPIDARYPVDGVTEEALRGVLPSFLGPQEQVAPLFSAKSVDGQRAYEIARKAYKARAVISSDHTVISSDHTVISSEAEKSLSKQNINIYELELLKFEEPEISPRASLGRNDNSAHVQYCTVIPSEAKESTASGRINVIDIAGEGLPHAEVLVGCSKGTYIRALARDLGEALGSGAFLDSLRRTRNGGYTLDDALSLEEALALFAE